MPIDSFYTPTQLAKELVAQYTGSPAAVVDFCAGGGELLKAAAGIWPHAKIHAVDYSEQAVNDLRKLHPKWAIAHANFLQNESMEAAGIGKDYLGYFDLILLNPPFSCRGATCSTIDIDNQSFKMSTAMSFLVLSIKYLSHEGTLLSILPASVAYSEKDKAIWNHLSTNYNIQIVKPPYRARFNGRCPNIILVSIDRKKSSIYPSPEHKYFDAPVIDIVRGKLPMPNISQMEVGNLWLVHTCNLQQNSIVNVQHKICSINSIIDGPAVLIPRVGNPRIDKIVLIKKYEKYAMSDCIIAITAASNNNAKKIYDAIIENWDEFFKLYNGTGAKYTTIDKIKSFFGY